MDPLMMAGAWAGAVLTLIALGKALQVGAVKVITGIFRTELQRVWVDMDDIENRLSALEMSMQFIRQQIEELRRMMETHVQGEK